MPRLSQHLEKFHHDQSSLYKAIFEYKGIFEYKSASWHNYARMCGSFLIAALSSNATAFSSLDRGYISLDSHYYPAQGQGVQEKGNTSLVFSAETSYEHDSGFYLKVTPYIRLDPEFTKRNSVQIKEFDLEYSVGSHIINAGVRQLSWSTVEAANVLPIVVADIINQRDIQADPDGQEKLGRPMLSYIFQTERFQFQFHYLPYFFERLEPEIEARESFTQGLLKINKHSLFSDQDEEQLPSWAARLEWVIGNTNAALIHHSGYKNEALYLPSEVASQILTHHFNKASSSSEFGQYGVNDLSAYYYKSNTSAFTLQSSISSWLIKLEASYVNTEEHSPIPIANDYASAVIGAEYTFIRPSKQADLGLFLEYVYDSRKEGVLGTPFSDDIFYGFRWASNNHSGSTLLGGVLSDLNTHSNIFHLNFNQRIGDNVGINATARFYDLSRDSDLYPFSKEHLLNIRLSYFF